MRRSALTCLLLFTGCTQSSTPAPPPPPIDGGVGDAGRGDAGDPDLTSCTQNTECVLMEPGCCSSCSPLTIDGVEAIAADKQSEFRSLTCEFTDPICPACDPQPNPELVAICDTGSCAKHDLGQLPITSCSNDDDCAVRYPDCCSCGASDPGPFEVFAYNPAFETETQELLCEPGFCALDCVPAVITTAEAYCAEDGHCALR